MAHTVLDGIDAVLKAAGTHLGYSDWLEVTQERVDEFAEATGDRQWIHTDPDAAARWTPLPFDHRLFPASRRSSFVSRPSFWTLCALLKLSIRSR